MLKNTAASNQLGALLQVWYLAIWSSASTHAKLRLVIVLYHFWNNIFGLALYLFLCFCALRSNFFLSFAGYVKKKFQSMQWLLSLQAMQVASVSVFIKCPELFGDRQLSGFFGKKNA